MGFRVNAICKVWQIMPKSDVNTQLRVSTSRKNKQTGNYDQDFSGFVSCVGAAAAKKAAKLNEGARIQIKECEVTTNYNKDKNITYTNFAIYDFLAEGEEGFGERGNSVKKDDPEPKKPVDDGEPEEPNLPF